MSEKISLDSSESVDKSTLRDYPHYLSSELEKVDSPGVKNTKCQSAIF
jgi:hypothetical protein